MNSGSILNSIGLLFTIIGVYIVYKNSPINYNAIDAHISGRDYDNLMRRTNIGNNWLRRGVCMVIFGTTLQLVSNFIT